METPHCSLIVSSDGICYHLHIIARGSHIAITNFKGEGKYGSAKYPEGKTASNTGEQYYRTPQMITALKNLSDGFI